MMQLLELTPAERAFLAAGSGAAGGLTDRLSLRLADVLSARLRLTTQLLPGPVTARIETCSTPVWQPDGALASLWLTRRLGGGRMLGQAAFVPRTLIDTLNEVLAECWLERPAPNALPAACAWAVTAGAVHAGLELRLPDQLNDMAHWAQGVIQRV